MEGGSALDAVETAVSVMEDDPIFNAGRGSSLTFTGEVEMDAAIMDGKNLSAGAVSSGKVKNPVRLARLVMEKTDHVLVAGRTAERLAKAYSLPTRNPITSRRRQMLLKLKKKPARRRITLGFVRIIFCFESIPRSLDMTPLVPWLWMRRQFRCRLASTGGDNYEVARQNRGYPTDRFRRLFRQPVWSGNRNWLG